MSVQKISKNPNHLKRPQKPFEMIFRQILDKVTDPNVLAVYCHLSGKPDNWEINDQYIMNHFGWGRDKARDALNCLIVNKLLRRIQLIDEKGKFAGRVTELLDGYDFKEFVEYDKKIHKKLCEYRSLIPSPEIPSYGFSVDGQQAATEEDIKSFKEEDIKVKREGGSLFYNNPYPKDFFPDKERRDLLSRISRKTNSTESELLIKFGEVSKRYKTKSSDWQVKFEEFLNNEKPKRVYEDQKGKIRRYDNQPMY